MSNSINLSDLHKRGERILLDTFDLMRLDDKVANIYEYLTSTGRQYELGLMP